MAFSEKDLRDRGSPALGSVPRPFGVSGVRAALAADARRAREAATRLFLLPEPMQRRAWDWPRAKGETSWC